MIRTVMITSINISLFAMRITLNLVNNPMYLSTAHIRIEYVFPSLLGTGFRDILKVHDIKAFSHDLLPDHTLIFIIKRLLYF